MNGSEKPASKLSKVTPLRKPVKCPSCKNLSSRETYPFCSKRCSDIDLGRWFNGSYALPDRQPDEYADRDPEN